MEKVENGICDIVAVAASAESTLDPPIWEGLGYFLRSAILTAGPTRALAMSIPPRRDVCVPQAESILVRWSYMSPDHNIIRPWFYYK